MNRDLFLQSENDILKQAEEILLKRLMRVGHVRDPSATIDYLRGHLAHRQTEVFGALYLDTKHGILPNGIVDHFYGTTDGAEVHPRVVVQHALEVGASAVLLFHNHPSGSTLESAADIACTKRIRECLRLFDIRLLDHIIIGGTESLSMASKGLV